MERTDETCIASSSAVLPAVFRGVFCSLLGDADELFYNGRGRRATISNISRLTARLLRCLPICIGDICTNVAEAFVDVIGTQQSLQQTKDERAIVTDSLYVSLQGRFLDIREWCLKYGDVEAVRSDDPRAVRVLMAASAAASTHGLKRKRSEDTEDSDID